MRNVIKTYELYPTLNPFSIEDMLKAHLTMMSGLVDEAGMFRRRGVGVFDGSTAVNDLFVWLENSDDHLLIRSCVFHYEFEFIHPFADGNGRIGRLWQSLILGKLNPLFEHLPVENMVYANQQTYYDAITQSSALGNSQPFIDFMLQEILNALEDHKGQTVDEIGEANSLSENEIKILGLIRSDRHMSAKRLAEEIGASQRQVERILAGLKDRSIIRRVGANRNGYWEVIG